jgi:hypothetical protein
VQAAVFVAQQFPRSVERAFAEMRVACGRLKLAERAFYRVTNRGNGPSIHLAKELARIWGNIDYGVRELHRDDTAGTSEILAFAWDQQTNSRQSRTFIVPHQRMAGGQRKALTDLQDIYLNNQNIGARALRECILTLLPTDYAEEAQDLCRKTIIDGDGQPLSDRVDQAVSAYAAGGVKLGQLEAKLDRKRAHWDAGDVATLQVIWRSINRGETTAEEEFPPATPTVSAIVNGPTTAPPAPSTPVAAADDHGHGEAESGNELPIPRESAPASPERPEGEAPASTSPSGPSTDDEPTWRNRSDSASKAQVKVIQTLAGTLGMDDQTKHQYAERLVGHTLAGEDGRSSFNNLTVREASLVVDALNDDLAQQQPTR